MPYCFFGGKALHSMVIKCHIFPDPPLWNVSVTFVLYKPPLQKPLLLCLQCSLFRHTLSRHKKYSSQNIFQPNFVLCAIPGQFVARKKQSFCQRKKSSWIIIFAKQSPPSVSFGILKQEVEEEQGTNHLMKLLRWPTYGPGGYLPQSWCGVHRGLHETAAWFLALEQISYWAETNILQLLQHKFTKVGDDTKLLFVVMMQPFLTRQTCGYLLVLDYTVRIYRYWFPLKQQIKLCDHKFTWFFSSFQDDILDITDSLAEDGRYKALDRMDADRKLLLFQVF